MSRVLDACCGSRMFWFDREHDDVDFMDIRKIETRLSDGRVLSVDPDILADFRDMPFDDESYNLVVFDPPHLLRAGDKSWLALKYGKLGEDWREDIAKGFRECMRVLKPNGVLVFKWNEDQVKLGEILRVTEFRPLFGNKRDKTHWLVFMKEDDE